MKKLFTRGKPSSSSGSHISKSPTLSLLDTTTHNVKPVIPAKYAATVMPHPHPFERISILAAEDGLYLRPDVDNPESGIKINWGKSAVIEEINDAEFLGNLPWMSGTTIAVYGIVGLLKLFNDTYLLVISERSHLGNFLDASQAVYSVKRVAAIPLDYQRAIKSTITILKNTGESTATPKPDLPVRGDNGTEPDSGIAKDKGANSQHIRFSPSTDERYALSHNLNLDVSDQALGDQSGINTPVVEGSPSALLAKTLASKLSFWNRKLDPSDIQPLSEHSDDEVSPEIVRSLVAPAPTTVEQRHLELEDKIVREVMKQFSRSGMYFAYSFDLSSSLERKIDQSAKLTNEKQLLRDLEIMTPSSSFLESLPGFKEPNASVPLWRRVDRKFWWNEHLLDDFINAGLHCYTLPLLQGHWQKVTFTSPVPRSTGSEDELPADESFEASTATVEYTVISRRSRERAGLRYQRRGADDDGNVANFVETEAVMSVVREGGKNIFGFTQIRGSIPLFWSQQANNALKPAPQLLADRSHDENLRVMRTHMEKNINRYGSQTIVNLAEQHGKEAAVTTAYRAAVEEWAIPEVCYYGYDFHTETKGMRYENISKLVDMLDRVFEVQGFTWILDGSVLSRQKGVFRVNCIDCLDRTNVVQSAFARHVLQSQLNAIALSVPETLASSAMTVGFNDVWANNGDAISRAYAGTSALKGDYTRTGKRDLTGLLNDGVNSLARMYTSTFSDWFSQSVIDYTLGYRGIAVFSEFLNKLSSSDPGALLRLSKIRLAGIETCASRVLIEGEQLLNGWTMLAPSELNTTVSDHFEERILLLSPKALYIVSYDYHLEKVKMFTRVLLGNIVGVQHGGYILSVLEEASRDPDQNYGLTISFSSEGQVTRVSSYSLRNSVDEIAKSPLTSPLSAEPDNYPTLERHAAILSSILTQAAMTSEGRIVTGSFKALPIDDAASYSRHETQNPESSTFGLRNCREVVEHIVECLVLACTDAGSTIRPFLVQRDIVSLADARRNATLYSKLEYNVKRLLWLGR